MYTEHILLSTLTNARSLPGHRDELGPQRRAVCLIGRPLAIGDLVHRRSHEAALCELLHCIWVQRSLLSAHHLFVNLHKPRHPQWTPATAATVS